MTEKPAVAHTPCWTELAAADPEAAKAYYSAVFGWRPETDPRPEAGGHCVFKLGEVPVAALDPAPDEDEPSAWGVCLAVEDAERAAEKAEQHGGKVLMPPAEVPGLGRYGVLADPGGAAFAVWEAGPGAGTEILGDPDALGWIELSTTDAKQALAFYPSVFGWATHLSDFYTEWSVGGAHFGGLIDLSQVPGAEGEPPSWKPYFRVEDVEETAGRAGALGGHILMAPGQVPLSGRGDLRVSVVRDPQGARFGIYEVLAPVGEES
jgi:predicted enzyme related to lactoylglutathione lyase